MRITVEDTTGAERTYEMPDSLDDISYAGFVRFAEDARETISYFLENVKDGTLDSNMGVYLYKLATTIGTFIGDDLNSAFRLPKGDTVEHISDMVSYCNAVAGQEGASAPEGVNLDQAHLSLFKIYNYLINTLMKYQPSLDRMQGEYSFEYAGRRYVVPGFLKDAITNQDVAPELPTGRAIEIYQVDKEFHDMVGELEKELIRQPDSASNYNTAMAGLKYNKTIRMLALFVRRDGEDFPLNPEQVKRYMDAMSVELQHIPARIGLDIVFFLNHTTALLELIRCTTMLSNHRRQKTSRRRR